MRTFKNSDLKTLFKKHKVFYSGNLYTFDDLKDIDCSQVSKEDLQYNFHELNMTTLEDAKVYAKYLYSNKPESIIIKFLSIKDDDLHIESSIYFANIIYAINSDCTTLVYGIDSLNIGTLNSNYFNSFQVLNPTPINWCINSHEISSCWKDKSYILKLLENSSHNQNLIAIKNIEETFFEDIDFLSKFLKINSCVKALPYYVCKSKLFAKLVSEDPLLFELHFFNNIIKLFDTVFQEFNIKSDNDSVIEFLRLSTENNNIYNRKITDEILSVIHICENFLNNESKCVQLLTRMISKRYSSSYSEIIKICQFFSPEVLKSNKIHSLIRQSYLKCSSNYGEKTVISILPKVLFSDKVFIKNVLKEEIAFSYDSPVRILNDDILNSICDELSFLDELIFIACENHDSRFVSAIANIFYEFLPSSKKETIEFYKILIKANHRSFYTFDENPKYKEFIYDNDVFDYICKFATPKNIAKMPIEFIFKIQNKETLRSILYENPNLGIHENAPKDWIHDISLVEPLGRKISNLNLTKKHIASLINSERDAIKLVTADPQLIKKLPKEYLLVHSVVLAALSSSSSVISSIDQSLLMNRSFCLELLKISSYYIEFISKSLFYDEMFILEFFRLLDNEAFKFDIISSLPKEIKQFILAHDLKVGNFYDFMKKYTNKQSLEFHLNSSKINQLTSNKKLKV